MRYSDDIFISMIEDLENNILNNKQIAEKYKCSVGTVEDFNCCKRHTELHSYQKKYS